MSSDGQQQQVPVNLGKPSLRRRLEAYYRQVAPDQIDNNNKNDQEWKERFDKIWSKFGGSCEGEAKLASKLAKKYGTHVRLVIVESSPHVVATRGAVQGVADPSQHKEDYFALSHQQRNSGVLSFTDANFDPLAVLASSSSSSSTLDKVMAANQPWLSVGGSTRLDRVDQCRSLLPPSDPMSKKATLMPASFRRQEQTSNTATTTITPKAPPVFVAMAALHETGPLSILHNAVIRRKRVRVVVRYLNGIRGTVTGHLLAFDKHYNMLLRDATEVYSPPQCTVREQQQQQQQSSPPPSPMEREVTRRLQSYAADSAMGPHWTCRQRHLPQILLRGDNVVLVYRADQEQSSWPVTNKSPATGTIYRKHSARRNVPPHLRVGTPGSLSLTVSLATSSRRQQQQARQQQQKTNAAWLTGSS